MTYNFDPDQWYENELAFIQSKYARGKLTKAEYEEAAKQLDKKHEEMWKQLDGSYQINFKD